jgi:hypothetical protein
MLLLPGAPDALEADLVSGRIDCPTCGGQLSPFGSARSRVVRMMHEVRTLKPRRALCHACTATTVLLPAWCVPRHRDGAEVVLAALLDAARGDGHRTIARKLGRPPGTVRAWLRRAHHDATARRWYPKLAMIFHRLGGDFGIPPASSPLGDALELLGRTVSAAIRQLGPPNGDPYEYASALTDGLIGRRPPRKPRPPTPVPVRC